MPRLNPRLLLALAPVFAVAACGSSREAELEKQLTEARAQVAEEAAARKKAERIAASMQANNQDLSDFYASDSRDDEKNADLQPHEPDDSDKQDAPAADAAPAPQEPPVG